MNREVWPEIAASLAAGYDKLNRLLDALGLQLTPQRLPDSLRPVAFTVLIMANVDPIAWHMYGSLFNIQGPQPRCGPPVLYQASAGQLMLRQLLEAVDVQECHAAAIHFNQLCNAELIEHLGNRLAVGVDHIG